MKKKILVAAMLAAGCSVTAQAATYDAIQDTSVYEFLGNLGEPSGDSSNVLVWNHSSNHGAKGLMQFDAGAIAEASAAGVGNFTATLNLYQVCELSSFVGACAGDAGAEVINTDIIMQNNAWSEDAAIVWGDINESTAGPFSTLTQTTNVDGWVTVDITDIMNAWVMGADDYGLSLSQEAYGVVRADNGSIAVAAFCDSESSSGVCATGAYGPSVTVSTVSAVPVPAAVWLFGSGLIGLAGIARRKTS